MTGTHEANDDCTYRADFSDLAEGAEEPSPFMWRTCFEMILPCAKPRASTTTGLLSAIEKIEGATSSYVQVEMAIQRDHARRRLGRGRGSPADQDPYTAATADEARSRSIEPREIKVLNGHTYVRAYCTTRESWRTFRVDRINAVVATSDATEERAPDTVINWLTQVGDEGDEVVVGHRVLVTMALRTVAQCAVVDARRRPTRRQIPRQQ